MRLVQNGIENDEKVENLQRQRMKQVKLSKEWNLFVREDQEITKTGLKKWKVQEESVLFIMYGEKAATI